MFALACERRVKIKCGCLTLYPERSHSASRLHSTCCRPFTYFFPSVVKRNGVGGRKEDPNDNIASANFEIAGVEAELVSSARVRTTCRP